MPTYQDPVLGSQISEAYAEAMSSAPITRVMYQTFEFRHPNFDEPIRTVNDFLDITAVLESTAPADPSTAVLFTAIPVSVSGPEEGESGTVPTVNINIDGVSGHIVAQLDLAINSRDPLYVTERIYASDDLSAPHRMPVVTMIVRTINAGDVTVAATASFYDPSNNAFPKKEYSIAEYPGLTA